MKDVWNDNDLRGGTFWRHLKKIRGAFWRWQSDNFSDNMRRISECESELSLLLSSHVRNGKKEMVAYQDKRRDL